jgi:hypothetical protein|nr:MAG TPA: hypothetical protein [Caudoviricetes sp.]
MPTDNEDMKVENIEEEVVDKAQEEQEAQNEKQLTQEDIDNAVKSRVGRVERKYKRELAEKDNELEELRQLKSTLRKGLELNEEDNVLEKINSFYKEQGVDIPQFESASNKRDTQRLGEFDAQDLIDSADFDEIQNRANELNKKIQQGKITERENAEFMQLGSYLTKELQAKELKEKGADENIIDDKSFKDFASKFNSNMPISEIYDLYSKLNHKEVTKPASTGSIKSSVGESKVKTYYTSEEVDKLTSKDLDNPTVFKNVMASMKKWGK